MMLQDCPILNLTNDKKITLNKEINLKYKTQSIVSKAGKPIAEELLLNFEHAQLNSCIKYYQSVIETGALTNESLEFIIERRLINSLNLQSCNKLFINIERNNLCDVRTLRLINEAAKTLENSNVSLVVEITERKCSNTCNRGIEGLLQLKNMGITLAIDDYDYISRDFRKPELDIGLYDYIKINNPQIEVQRDNFEKIIDKSFKKGLKVIVEHIESRKDFEKLPHDYIYGYQGYHFCIGKPIFQ
ncbi:EAL domain-containing protein [Shewanella mangrovisoli]|uniref:EAL domain-containing protein n=1 Tax=Shewanella mangrovisoli TaxID=2864211 RepID=UPI0035B6F138